MTFKTSLWRMCYGGVAGLVVMALMLLASPAAAQEADNWSPETKLFSTQQQETLKTIEIITDSGHNTHALLLGTRYEGDIPAILYTSWDGKQWSQPLDVFLLEGLTLPVLSAVDVALDDQDYIHLIYGGGAVYHAKVHITQVADTRAWERQLVAADDVFTKPAVAFGPEGTVHVVYGVRALDRVMYARLPSGQDAWLPAREVYGASVTDTWIGYPGIVVTPGGDLLVWWNQMEATGENSGRNKGVQIARSTNDGESWSMPNQVVEGYYQAFYYNLDEVLARAVAGGLGTGGRYVAFSYDEGHTWTVPKDIGLGGVEGQQSVTVLQDGDGVWHFVEQTAAGFALAPWDGADWRQPIFLANPCCLDPQNPVGGISNGNLVHLFWESHGDPVSWYAGYSLKSPPISSSEVKTNPLQVVSDSTVVPDTKTPLQIIEKTKLEQREVPVAEQETDQPSVIAFICIALPSFSLVTLVIIINRYWIKR